jgi:N-acetylglucosamine kinase
MNALILGLDCGGTKTAAALAKIIAPGTIGSDFQILGKGSAGPSNPCAVGETIAFSNVERAIRGAFEQAQITAEPVDTLALCMAGMGRPEEMEQVRAWALAKPLALNVIVTEDIDPVRWAALWESEQSILPSGSARQTRWDRIVTLISGTGSIACCTDHRGRTQRVGGWGHLLGDEGSGFMIGLQGLRCVCASYDSGLPMSELHRELLSAFDCETVPQLIPTTYRIPLPRPEIAALSRIVLRYADSDPQARTILEDAVNALALLVRRSLSKVPSANTAYLLAVTGGLMESSSPILRGVLRRLEQDGYNPTLTHVVQHPVHGALVMAARAIRIGKR